MSANEAPATEATKNEVKRPKIGSYRRHLLVCTGPRCSVDGAPEALF